MKRQNGFTIIEIMISMTILAFIAMGVYQNTTQTFQLRDKVEQDGDFYNSIRVSLDILGRDISHIYSPQSAALPGDLGKPQTAQPGQPNVAMPTNVPPTAFWSEPINSHGVKATRFQGEASKISFVISSHMRLFKDSPESDFAKITYELGEDPLAPRGTSGKALLKTEDYAAFEEVERPETAVTYTLLTNIKSLKFEYLDGEKDTTFGRWDTSGIEHKGVFPSVIKVTIEVTPPNSENPITVIQEYKPELPL